jgi:predicted transcriptional regulator
MHLDIPEDLHHRLQHLAQATGKDIEDLLREAIETGLAVQEHAAKNLEGWTQEALCAAIEEGLASGPSTPLDMEAVKRRAWQQWEQSGQA